MAHDNVDDNNHHHTRISISVLSPSFLVGSLMKVKIGEDEPCMENLNILLVKIFTNITVFTL